jgi:hypothetical protein
VQGAGSRNRLSDFNFRVVSVFGFQLPGSGFWISCFKFGISGIGMRLERVAVQESLLGRQEEEVVCFGFPSLLAQPTETKVEKGDVSKQKYNLCCI